MNTVHLNSASEYSTTTAMEEEGEEMMETRDSCYFPGCRKNTNCNCRMCLASITATLDLMPASVQKSTLTKLSSSRLNVERTPLSFDASVLSTPESSHRRIMASLNLRSSGRSILSPNSDKPREGDLRFLRTVLKLVFVLSFAFAVDTGFSWAVSEVFQPKISSVLVKKMGENSRSISDFNGKLRSFQIELQSIVDGKVSNCSNVKSLWEINQDGTLLHSKCVLHKSAIEEVSIWGWPLQTAGLLTTGFSHRSFTILSGRLTEWSDGMSGYTIRKANTSWVHKKWEASAVHLDSNTWILEYKRSSLLDKSIAYSALIDVLKYRASTMVKRLKEEFWILFALESSWHGELKKKKKTGDIKIPT